MRYKMMQESNAKPSAEGPTMCNDSAVKQQIKFSSDLLKGGKKTSLHSVYSLMSSSSAITT